MDTKFHLLPAVKGNICFLWWIVAGLTIILQGRLYIKWGAGLHVVGHIFICFCIFILLLLFLSLFLFFILNFFFVFASVLFYDREKRKIMKLDVSVGLFCNEILSYMAKRHYSLCFIKFPWILDKIATSSIWLSKEDLKIN